MKALTEALAKAQADIQNAPLNSTNPHYKSRYADLAAIRDAVIPALSKNGIAVVQVIEVREFGPVVVTRLLMGDEFLESVCPIAVGQTYKPQEFGSAVTYARRYSLAAICCIAAEEDDDATAAQSAKSAAKRPSQKKSAPEKKQDTNPDLESEMIHALHNARSIAALEGIKADPNFKADFEALSEEGKANVVNASTHSLNALEAAAEKAGETAHAA